MRNWFLVLLGSLGVLAAEIKPEVVKTLVEVPEDEEYFLQQPASFDVDKEGSFYVVDWTARVLFKWNAEGDFERIIGAPGGGPGEFGFMGQGGPQGYLGIVDNVLYIYDGGRRAVAVFDNNGKFIDSKSLQLETGRTNSFYIAAPDSWLINHSNFMSETPALTISIYDNKDKKDNILLTRANDTFERKSSGGNVTGVVIEGFAPQLIAGYNSSNGQVVAGYGGDPFFNVYDKSGKLLKKVPVKRTRREVKKEDKDEFNEVPWIKNNQFFTVSFPERMPYYSNILPIGKDHFLVFEMSPFYRKAKGILIDDQGNTKGAFQFECGENGGLLSGSGRILRVRTDDEGFFNLEELKFKEAS